ncbi:MarR family transcriptional regulator [Enterobacter hormaechei]|uniref:MarR family transcriptional regulator n=1 Tax=Enterobacter hormaechei TaxID=158836 RepID=UPI001F21CF54|nr:MarR family transcriptional regulator [Enterobacter hormaechei]MCG0493070.1 MarR family transcriptional regulator [Enterobacter hormaechei]MCG0533794.1 MarR family transcriptional regulator [Enterobacter hormaechei]MCG0547107.1 MarR family transcriptional regulator [Enterobacter hormaechei]MCG0552792.1 MarR family transcriptional regulator [Enterobacter hormaechei]MCG0565320.1 MarR family transcriptional regulator [Enterobacter hormaechei]
MTKIKYIDTNDFDYVPSETAFLECTRITNLKSGITESLTNNDKDFYVRMRHRYYYFVKELGGTYYDNVDQLGQSIGVSPATATRIVAKLRKIGLISSDNPKRSNQWTVTPLTPENFLLERDRNALEDKADPDWVDCMKHPVFGNAKEDVAPEVQEEKQPVPEADPMCEFDDTPEEEAPAPEKVKPTPKPTKKPAARKAPTKQQIVSPFEFRKPRDETRDWWYLERYNHADQFTGFNDFDLPYLAMFDSQGTLTNEYAIQHLKMKRDSYARQQQT